MKIRYLLAGAVAAAGFALVAPAATPAQAQGVHVDVPGVHVGVGGRRHYDDGYRYRERRMYMRDGGYRGCRTVTIHRDNGSVKQIRKCG